MMNHEMGDFQNSRSGKRSMGEDLESVKKNRTVQG